MSKNNRKKISNSSSKTPGQPSIPSVTSTLDEKEGMDTKQKLIEEGKTRKTELIAEGEAEKKEIIERAKDEAQKTASEEKEKIISDYISQVKEKAQREAEEERIKILSDTKELKAKTEALSKQTSEESNALKEKSNILEKQNREYLDKFAKLQSEKESYKNEILLETQDELVELQDKIKNLEKEKHQIELKNNQLERNISFSNADKEELEGELANYTSLYEENSKLKIKKTLLESENCNLNDIRQELQDDLEQKNNIINRFGDDPQKLLSENSVLNEEITELRDRLANTPEINELKRLRETSQQYSQLQQQNETLLDEKRRLEKSLFDAKTYQADLENKDRFIRVLELQCTELQTELDRITERYNKNSAKIFAGLSKIDEEHSHASYGNSNISSLKELCTNFKDYLASQKGLFYTDTHIRTFIAGFASSRLIILEGMSGTGKSSLPREFGEFIGSQTARIPVQSSWKDRNDLLGFYNDFEKRYKETDFLKAIYSAVKDKDNIHCILLDEMNLSRIEYYFADMLSILEEPNPADWKISLVPDVASVKGEIPEYIKECELLLSENIWFAGTANKDDSTFTITDKVYDRAIVLDFKERTGKPRDIVQQPRKENLSYSEFYELLQKAVKCSATEKKEIEDMTEELDMHMQTHFEISFGNRISSQIEKFVPAYQKCGGLREEAFDILFSTKVLRKIQGYDKATEEGLAALLTEINDKYPNNFNLSKSIIKKLQSRI